MKVQIICVGKTSFDYISEGIKLYEKRLQHYLPLEWIELPEIKKNKHWTHEQIKKVEGELLLKKTPTDAIVTLLDVKGKNISSEDFSQFVNQRMLSGLKTLTFIIGGAYGFSEEVYQRSQFKLSLSKMTFSHQLVRIVFLEQLYRAMTILKGEPYHH